MFGRLKNLVIACLSVTLFAAMTVYSATQMAPDHDALMQKAEMIAAGATLADICSEELDQHDHEHRCPVCNELPRSEQARAPESIIKLSIAHEHHYAADLITGPQLRHSHVAARAPPAAV